MKSITNGKCVGKYDIVSYFVNSLKSFLIYYRKLIKIYCGFLTLVKVKCMTVVQRSEKVK